MRSLRGALILGTSLGTVLVFSAAGVLLYFLLRASLVSQIDRALEEKARLLASNVEIRGTKLKLELDWAVNDGKNGREDRDEFEIWDSGGAVAYRSSGLHEILLLPFGNPLDRPAEFRWLALENGIDGRALGVTFQPERSDEPDDETETKPANPEARSEKAASPPIGSPASNASMTLVLVRDVTRLNATLAHMRLILLGVGCGTAVGLSALLALIIGHSLRSLEKLQHDISLLDADDLSTRIQSPNLPSELLPLVARLNELLSRLEMAFERERNFSADIAHELRTPLAGLRTTIEVTLARLRPPDDYQNALHACQRITVQLQSLVESLLSLVRLESGEQPVHLQMISINAFLQDQWSAFATTAQQRHLHVEWLLGADQPLNADVASLSIALQNLFANAVEYADEGGWIKIATHCAPRQFVITLANSGSRVSQQDIEHVFDRFWRGDRARSSGGTHFGLGLSLVKRTVVTMGGSVQAQADIGGVFSVSLTLRLNDNDIDAKENTEVESTIAKEQRQSNRQSHANPQFAPVGARSRPSRD
jgi:two-component system, OmpR family, heavy metal sensor histidine kinase CusS